MVKFILLIDVSGLVLQQIVYRCLQTSFVDSSIARYQGGQATTTMIQQRVKWRNWIWNWKLDNILN